MKHILLFISLFLAVATYGQSSIEIPKGSSGVSYTTTLSPGQSLRELSSLFGQNFVVSIVDTIAGTIRTEWTTPSGYSYRWQITGVANTDGSITTIRIKGQTANAGYTWPMSSSSGVPRKGFQQLISILNQKYTTLTFF